MKTTLNLRDDIVRRAKARAALRGQALARYIEEGLERRLLEDERQGASVEDWMRSLPRLSRGALRDIERAFSAGDFRAIDAEMWR